VAAVATGLAIAAVLFVLLSTGRAFFAEEQERLMRKPMFAWLGRHGVSGGRYVAVGLGFLQVVGSFGNSFFIAWPDTFMDFLSALSLVHIDVLRLPSLACAADKYTYFSGVLLNAMLPLGWWAILAAVWAGGRTLHHRARQGIQPLAGGSLEADMGRFGSRDAYEQFVRACCRLAQLGALVAYPPVSAAALSVFSCRGMFGTHYLMGDYSVECYTGQHQAWMAGSAVLVVAYPVGLAVGLFVLLQWWRVPQLADIMMRDAARRHLVGTVFAGTVAGPGVQGCTVEEVEWQLREVSRQLVEDQNMEVEVRALYRRIRDGVSTARGQLDAVEVMLEASGYVSPEMSGRHHGTHSAEEEEEAAVRLVLLAPQGLADAAVEWVLKSNRVSPSTKPAWGAVDEDVLRAAVCQHLVMRVLRKDIGGPLYATHAVLEQALAEAWSGGESKGDIDDIGRSSPSQGPLADLMGYLYMQYPQPSKAPHDPTQSTPQQGKPDAPPPVPADLAYHSIAWALDSRAVAAEVPELGESRALARVGFLFQDFEPHCWWFGLADLLYKLAMTGLVVFVSEGTSTRVLAALVLNLFFLRQHIRWSPYANDAVDRFHQATEISTLLTLVAGLCIYGNIDVADQAARERWLFQAILIGISVVGLVFPLLEAISGAAAASAWRAVASLKTMKRKFLRKFPHFRAPSPSGTSIVPEDFRAPSPSGKDLVTGWIV